MGKSIGANLSLLDIPRSTVSAIIPKGNHSAPTECWRWVLSLKTSKPPLTITSAHRFDLGASWDGFAWTRSPCRCKVLVPKHFFHIVYWVEQSCCRVRCSSYSYEGDSSWTTHSQSAKNQPILFRGHSVGVIVKINIQVCNMQQVLFLPLQLWQS